MAEAKRKKSETGESAERLPTAWFAVAVLVAALVVLTGFLGFRYYRLAGVESARDSSLTAAKSYAQTMFSYEPENVDEKIARAQGFVIEGARKEFDEQVTQLKMAHNVKSNRIISKLDVADAGVVTNTRTTSTVLLFLNQSVTSKAEPKVRIDPSRVQFTMVRQGGDWKINSIEIFTDDSLRKIVEKQGGDRAPAPSGEPAPR
ncbi:hypothetical protein GOARA_045_00690 [Gordonia araii NBRC 100433]|uniref:Mce-associated membrane protein n=1 Tax=Gordonia araii NBRC 100433 TaxID=1073574 RepID=G7H1J0_9ACTN|nr:hypothetical protein [Gordonia araii]NNG97776.1 hypothetical protein [Gordonia araii NBRC 100433]GAB09715.1 hypothetical protein GOARA_045_00690 [Gordonia araii NBRC 100433]